MPKTPRNTSLGFEYDKDVVNDQDYYKKIFESDCFNQNAQYPLTKTVQNERVIIIVLFASYLTSYI